MKLTSAPHLVNPWNLTARETEVLKALAEHGADKRAAQALGMTKKGIEFHMQMIKARMQQPNRLLAVLAFDRWLRKA